MAHAPELRSVESVQGPSGHGGLAEILKAPLADGSPPDVVSAALPEAPLEGSRLRTFCAAQFPAPPLRASNDGAIEQKEGEDTDERPQGVDAAVFASAKAESVEAQTSRVMGLIEGWAGDYNGDLKILVGYSSRQVDEDPSGALFGPLIDHTVAGIAVPNPKKSFLGRSMLHKTTGLRLVCVGAHLPITAIAALLESEDPTTDPLEASKRAMAGVLRKVLRKAGRRPAHADGSAATRLLDHRTVLFLQGDLNSRTVLQGGQVFDVLQEVIRDDVLQKAICHNLQGVPAGRWYEPVQHPTARDLPVTYKFQHSVAPQTARGPKGRPAFTLGELVDLASQARLFPNAPELGDAAHSPAAYRQALLDVGDAARKSWGIAFKPNAFRPFRFPASADRVILWAPDVLQPRLSWTLPQEGYTVNHAQGGSDHKPVCMEVVLHVAPFDARGPQAVDGMTSACSSSTGHSYDCFSACAHISEMLDKEADAPRSARLEACSDEDDEDAHSETRSRAQSHTGTGSAPRSSENVAGGPGPGSAADVGGASLPAPGMPSSAYGLRLGRPQPDWNWTPDKEVASCEICDTAFTVFRRRHHCRLCGCCICNECSPREVWRSLPQFDMSVPCRLCTRCGQSVPPL